jgi:sugar phosphate permease
MIKSLLNRLPFSYAWVILVILFLGLLTSFGARTSFGAFITPWETDFNISRTAVTSISTLSFIVFAVAQPLAGKLNDQFGGRIVPSVSIILVGSCLLLSSLATRLWQLFLIYGIGFSLGVAGCSNVIAAAVITKWFKAKQGFALGLAVSGMAVGQLIVVPSSLFLIERYGWRTSMAVIGLVICAVVVPLTILFVRSKPEDFGLEPYGASSAERRDPSEKERNTSPRAETTVFGVMKIPAFWQLAVPYFICGFTDVGFITTHLIPFTQGRGFGTAIAALTFSVIAALNIVGTIVTGHLSDHFHRSRQLGIIYSVRAITFLFLLLIQSPWLLIPFAVVYGATEMASIAPTSSLAASLFDQYSVGTIIGFISVSHQIGGALGSWIPGILFDLTGSYHSVLILSIVLLAGSALLVLQAPDPRKTATARRKNA